MTIWSGMLVIRLTLIKFLLGEKTKFKSIRQKDGLAPFPAIYESEYDAFGVGHSSTSISAILGMAMAVKRRYAR